jgi:plasmid stabilization system protein ParE
MPRVVGLQPGAYADIHAIASFIARRVSADSVARWRHVYRILFAFDGQTVTVLRVRHAAQDCLTDEDV